MIVHTLKELLDTFVSTGFYTCLIMPDKGRQDGTYIIPTWGDFNEFKSKIVAACSDRMNTASPANLGPDSMTGGFVIGGILGVNSPKAIDSFIHNMQIFEALFGIKTPFPGAPKGVRAMPGIYSSGLFSNKAGIKISWNKAGSDSVTGYKVYRCELKEGVMPSAEDMQKILISNFKVGGPDDIKAYSGVRVYDNGNVYALTLENKFNKGNPVTVLADSYKQSFSIIDYDVIPGQIYYYKVFSMPGTGDLIFNNPYNTNVNSPLGSQAVGAMAFKCIPVSEIPNGMVSLEGDFVNPRDLRYQWTSLTLKTFLGPNFENLFNSIDMFADKLLGYVSTSSDALMDYLDFFQKKISNYIRMIEAIEEIIMFLMNFRLDGSVLLLNIPLSKGGIDYFKNSVANSKIYSQNFDIKKSGINNQGASLKTIEGFYYGIIVVYDVPDPDSYKQITREYITEYNGITAQLNSAANAISTLSNILVGKK
jgi:hypothetical protein